MGSKHRLAPRLAELFATLPPGPAIDAFSGSGVVAYTLKAAGRETHANDHLTFTATLAEALVANQDEQLDAEDVETLCSPNRDGRDFIAATFAGLYFPDADHAFLDAAWSHVDELRRRQAGAGAERALPGGGLEAAARRLHGHHAALRRRPPPAPHAARGALPRGGGAAATPPSCPARRSATLRRRVRARPGRRRARLPRPAVRAAPRRHVLRQALPLPRGPGDVLARPGDHVGDAHAQAAQAPHAVRLQAHRARRARPPVRPLQRPAGARRLLRLKRRPRRRRARGAARAATAARVRRIEIPHRYAFGTHAAADAAARDRVRVRRPSATGLYSGRCRRW